MLEFMLISFMASEFMIDLLPAVSSGTGMEWEWNKYRRGRTGMEVKVDGDGCGWKQSLRGRVGMGVISVPMQV